MVDEGTCRVVRPPGSAVGSVGIGSKRGDPGAIAEGREERQQVFLVRSAAALAVHRNGELTARQDHGAPALRLDVARKFCMAGRHQARFAFEIGTQSDALAAGGAHQRLDLAESFGRTRRQRKRSGGKAWVARLRCLVGGIAQRPAHGR